MRAKQVGVPRPTSCFRFLSLYGGNFGEEGKEEKRHCGISWSDRRQVYGVRVINRDENVYLHPVT